MIFLPGRNTDRFVDMRPEQGYSRFRLAGEQIVKFRLHGFTHGRSIRRNTERDIHLHGPRGKNMDVRRYRPAFVDMGLHAPHHFLIRERAFRLPVADEGQPHRAEPQVSG